MRKSQGNAKCKMRNAQCTMYNVQCTMYNAQCTMKEESRSGARRGDTAWGATSASAVNAHPGTPSGTSLARRADMKFPTAGATASFPIVHFPLYIVHSLNSNFGLSMEAGWVYTGGRKLSLHNHAHPALHSPARFVLLQPPRCLGRPAARRGAGHHSCE